MVTNINFLLTRSMPCHKISYENLIKWSLKQKFIDPLSTSLNWFFKNKFDVWINRQTYITWVNPNKYSETSIKWTPN